MNFKSIIIVIVKVNYQFYHLKSKLIHYLVVDRNNSKIVVVFIYFYMMII